VKLRFSSFDALGKFDEPERIRIERTLHGVIKISVLSRRKRQS
jgi:hypothetical protein